MARTFFVLLPVMVLAAPNDTPARVASGLAAYMQAMVAIKEYVASGELGPIHNEEASLSTALAVLQTETTLDSRAKQQDLAETIASVKQQMAEMHEAADASNLKDVKQVWHVPGSARARAAHVPWGQPAPHRGGDSDRRPAPTGQAGEGTLRLINLLNGTPVSPGDLRIVHTERIHLLIIEPSLTD